MKMFVHLHVASGYSLRHGTATPAALVARAVEFGQDAIALTDRDGLYAAVPFVLACRDAGISPILGVDLAVPAVGDAVARRAPTPARGGVGVDPGHPRVVLLARGRPGWASLCRAVSATHLSGERGRPVADLETLAANGQGLVALLGPASELGRALERRRPDIARLVLQRWQEAFPGEVVIEVVSHLARDRGLRGPAVPSGATGFTSSLAGRMLGFARDVGVTAVLSNSVRYLEPGQAPLADVLDAVRRLVPLDPRHLDRSNAEGYLKDSAAMTEVAREVVRSCSSAGARDVGDLLGATTELADSCRIDPVADLGLGSVHVPELDVLFPAGLPGGVRAGVSDPATPAQLQARLADRVLADRCGAALDREFVTLRGHRRAEQRMRAELDTVARLGYAGYFLTVAEVVDLIRGMGIRVAARGSGAGSLVNYLLGISGVNPLDHDLIMERFLSPLRQALPDIDIDVESARRTEIYTRILERFSGQRCVCVSMMETYRVRHAVRDVGAALGLPPGEVDDFAKAFPHIRARDARAALVDLPELRRSELGRLAASGRLTGFLDLVEGLDGLPRHIALHPCGVLLSDVTLLDRTPVEASWMGFPMSQFDKDAVEEMGFLKLDVLGIRMQSAMAHALDEIVRLSGSAQEERQPGIPKQQNLPTLADGRLDLDRLPRDDEATFQMIRTTHTLGCFQIESPGQRELIGKFAPETFEDLIIDISLFRPGPVKSDMITPFLKARQGWEPAQYLHEDLRAVLGPTHGVVVFHEQVIGLISVIAGCSLAEGDEARRTLGSPEGQARIREWFYPRALARGYELSVVEQVWDVLRSFASFGFCKAHAAAFALPTYQSAWLKAHYPAAFLAGVLTHDPGMYPKRLILDDARNLGISILGPEVNHSGDTYRVEFCPTPQDRPVLPGLPDGSAYGIRLPFSEIKGVSAAEVARMVAAQPYSSLSDFWHRAGVSTPVVENLVVTGAFDGLYGINVEIAAAGPRGLANRDITRRDLLLEVADLDRMRRSDARAGHARPSRARPAAKRPAATRAEARVASALAAPGRSFGAVGLAATGMDPVLAAAAQSQAPAAARQPEVQLTLGIGEEGVARATGLPEMTSSDAVRAELELLGMDVSHHVMDFYKPMLADLGVVPARDLLSCRSRSEVWVAGVKVATQTPPVRSGHRVVFLTVDDSTGPVDATFFEAAQEAYAATVFSSWLLLVRGEVRRTGPRGLSLQATGCWDLAEVHKIWHRGGRGALAEYIRQFPTVDTRRRTRIVMEPEEGPSRADAAVGSTAGGMGQRRRVLVHASGFQQSPYADIRPAGDDPAGVPKLPPQPAGSREGPPGKLWHSSPGSSGW